MQIEKAKRKIPNQAKPSYRHYNNSKPTYGCGFGDAYGGFGGGVFSGGESGGYRLGDTYRVRSGHYKIRGYEGYGRVMRVYRGVPALGYSGRYRGALSRGCGLVGDYGVLGES